MTVKQLRERAKKHGYYMLNILPQNQPTFVLVDNETLKNANLLPQTAAEIEEFFNELDAEEPEQDQ